MNFSIADKLENVRKRIQKATISAGRSVDDVQLLAVSKKHPAQSVYDAYQMGQKRFGENYVSEALEKQEALQALCREGEAAEIEWHFIGPIQSNKSRLIAENFAWAHSVDRLKIAQRLNDQRPADFPPLNVCIQINIDDEASKSGILLEELPAFVAQFEKLPRLSLRGLMCIPKASQSEVDLAAAFTRMQQAYESLRAEIDQIDTLSMGMSGDIELAIEQGSTMVRIGTAIFGVREN